MASMALLALKPVRRLLFNVFYSFHVVGAVAAIVFGVLHGGIAGVGVGLWALDVALRYGYMAWLANPRKASLHKRGTDIACIDLARPAGFRYNGGQYCFVCVPGVSLWQWHPISISSDPRSDRLLFHVRAAGDCMVRSAGQARRPAARRRKVRAR